METSGAILQVLSITDAHTHFFELGPTLVSSCLLSFRSPLSRSAHDFLASWSHLKAQMNCDLRVRGEPLVHK